MEVKSVFLIPVFSDPRSIWTAYRTGEVPRYLRQMKLHNEERQRIEAAIDLNCPPGHVGLSEDERLEALEFANLSEKYNDLMFINISNITIDSH